MIWILIVLAILVVLAVALGALTIVLARRVVMPSSPRIITIHEAGEGTVTLQDDGKTAHAGEYGLWFGEDGHALIGPVLSRDTAARTVTRQILAVTAGELAPGQGRWTGHVIPHPRALERSVEDIDIPVADGDAPAWLIRAQQPAQPETWAIHIHGVRTTRITALRSVPAADQLGYTSLVVSFRGDTEGPAVLNGASTLGLTEWPDVDAAIAYALGHGAERVVLFAWSMGASIALQLTEHSAHRDVITGLGRVDQEGAGWPAAASCAGEWACEDPGAAYRGLPELAGGGRSSTAGARLDRTGRCSGGVRVDPHRG